MYYGIAYLTLLAILYFENKYHREQVSELRRVMDLQFEGLRSEFANVKDSLRWIEPRLKQNSFNNSYVAVQHTALAAMSIDDIRAAVDAGRYQSAMLPVTEYTPSTLRP
jgi:hypothetical protein